MSKHLVFVYGTLRQGGIRAMPGLFPAAKFIGTAKIVGSLYDLGAYPGLVLDESSAPVTGEVYEIDEEILRELDEIEASSNYRREQIEASLDNQKLPCWVYGPEPESYSLDTLITSGDWIEYAKTRTDWPEGE
jgi:gamma-glutamylcyclotransferase (GGCT)/AIG2-like uncharacterized protein YtfP